MILTLEQNTPEWIEFRRQGIGGSDIAAILGVCKYKTPYQLYCEKLNIGPQFKGNWATVRGSEQESTVRAKYEFYNLEDMRPACAIHPKYEIARSSLDGISENNKLILEIKCPGEDTHKIAQEKRVPEHYFPQTQWNLMVTGADLCHYFSYSFKDQTTALVSVVPDIDFQGMMLAKAIDFWNNHVIAKVAPQLTEKDILIVDDVEVKLLCEKLKAETEESKAKALKAEIIKLGGHTKVRCGNVLVSKSVTKTGKDSYRLTISDKAAS
jgi:putative phage-type endonuclease